MLSRIQNGGVSGVNLAAGWASEGGMKKTAGELIEMIPVVEQYDGKEVRVVARCPVCHQTFSSTAPGTLSDLRATAVNSAVTHIRCVHPED